MRNIYNLLSDAFDRMGLVETNYQVKIEGNYVITLKSPQAAANQKAVLYLDLTESGEIYDVNCTNNLFIEERWAEFCSVFTDEML
jgi:hypothetical protein